MGFMDSIFGSDPEVQALSLLSKDQQELLGDVTGFIREGMARGATESTYAPYATSDIFTQALASSAGLIGTGTDVVTRALLRQAAGEPGYRFDPGAITKDWKRTFAEPMMAAWREDVLPVVRESFNLPGMFHSTVTGRGVANAANQFYGQVVAPTLYSDLQQGRQMGFTSAENALSRQLQGAISLGQLPMIAGAGALGLGQTELMEQQRILAALRGEEARMMPESSPWLQPAMGLATTPTMENVVIPGQQGFLGQAVGAGLGIATMGGMSMLPGIGGGMEAFFNLAKG